MKRFTVSGRPQGKARARVIRRDGQTHAYTPPNTAEYERLIQMCYLTQCGGVPLEGAVKLTVYAFYAVPKGMRKAERSQALMGTLRPQTKPDIDNVLKAVSDALNGLAYRDDAQIVEITGYKRYGAIPHITVEVKEVEYDADG